LSVEFVPGMASETGSLRLTLDDLVALNDEIIALSRAGVPLHAGLGAVSRDLPGRLGKAAATISNRLQAGETLERVLAEPGNSGLPETYAAVVAAGVRAGRLPAALEGIAHALRRHAQLRTTIALSLLYPLIIIVVTFALMVFWVDKIGPVLSDAFAEWGGGANVYGDIIRVLHETSPLWGYGVPAFVVIYGIWLWYRSGRAMYGSGKLGRFGVGLVPRVRRMRVAAQKGLFADVLAVLLEHETPLDEALLIAGRTVGHPTFREGARLLAERIRAGQPPTTDVDGFPPVIGALLVSVGSVPPAQALKRIASTYHDDAARRAHWLATYVPLVFSVALAGGIVILYAALTIVPWFVLLHNISLQAGR
jgi:general secretion pathway protein F